MPARTSVVAVAGVTRASSSPVPAVVSLGAEPILIAAAAILFSTRTSAPAGPDLSPGYLSVMTSHLGLIGFRSLLAIDIFPVISMCSFFSVR